MSSVAAIKKQLVTANKACKVAYRDLLRIEKVYQKAEKKNYAADDRVEKLEEALQATEEAEKKAKFKGKWFKFVTSSGLPSHGGSLSGGFSLPQNGKPGKVHSLPANRQPSACSQGFHCTTDPKRWYALGLRLFEVKAWGNPSPDGNKTAFRHVQFLREIKKNTPEFKALTGHSS